MSAKYRTVIMKKNLMMKIIYSEGSNFDESRKKHIIPKPLSRVLRKKKHLCCRKFFRKVSIDVTELLLNDDELSASLQTDAILSKWKHPYRRRLAISSDSLQPAGY